MFAGSLAAGYLIGRTAKKNFETTNNVLGHVKIQEPMWRTEKEELELEERLEAEQNR